MLCGPASSQQRHLDAGDGHYIAPDWLQGYAGRSFTQTTRRGAIESCQTAFQLLLPDRAHQEGGPLLISGTIVARYDAPRAPAFEMVTRTVRVDDTNGRYEQVEHAMLELVAGGVWSAPLAATDRSCNGGAARCRDYRGAGPDGFANLERFAVAIPASLLIRVRADTDSWVKQIRFADLPLMEENPLGAREGAACFARLLERARKTSAPGRRGTT